jgi:hypothetical protein
MTSEVLDFVDPATGAAAHTAWFRRLRGSGHILYAGFYSACQLPGEPGPCIKVVFPLPNGNAIVLMRTACLEDGSFLISSAGEGFGQAGFYFTVDAGRRQVWARCVKALKETIHVYGAEEGKVRADHVLKFFGATFLRLHYLMRRRPS